jgi:predicted metal-dependent phosphoesterase TrpH
LKDHIKATNPVEVIDEIKKQGGIAVLAHPLAHHPNLTDNILRKLDGCEGFNARHARHRKPDTPYGENHLVKFAKKYNYFLIAGSDAHFYHEIGKGRTIIPAENLQDIKEAIVSGFTTLDGTRTSPLYLFATTIYKIANVIFNPVPEERA